MAHVDYFLKIKGIEGESSLNGYIQVLGWSWGVASNHPGGVNRPGKVSVQDLSFVHHVDVASPKILQAGCEGQRFEQAWLVGQGDQAQPVMTMVMNDVGVTDLRAQAGGADPVVVEQISLNFSKIEYSMVGADGQVVVAFCDGSVHQPPGGI